jgi:hypothetical protein
MNEIELTSRAHEPLSSLVGRAELGSFANRASLYSNEPSLYSIELDFDPSFCMKCTCFAAGVVYLTYPANLLLVTWCILMSLSIFVDRIFSLSNADEFFFFSFRNNRGRGGGETRKHAT